MHCIQQLLSKLYMTFCVAAETQHGSVTLKNPVIFEHSRHLHFSYQAPTHICAKTRRLTYKNSFAIENQLGICEMEKSHAVPNDARGGKKRKKSLFLSN